MSPRAAVDSVPYALLAGATATEGLDQHLDVVHRVVLLKDSERRIDLRAEVEHDAEGRPVRLSGIGVDVTEKMAAEDVIRDSEARLSDANRMLQAVLDATPVRYFWKDLDLRYLGCNTNFAKDAGFDSPSRLLGKDDFAMGWRDQSELYRADDRAVIESVASAHGFAPPPITVVQHVDLYRLLAAADARRAA